MTTRRGRKVRKFRGSKTHGKGIGSKHSKGAGSRGGRGMAGSGKRADQKKPSIWKEAYFGKSGFSSKSRAPEMHIVNIKSIEDRLDNLVAKGLVKHDKDTYTLNLADLGYNKLLSTGKVTKKFMIKTDFATETAVEKIKEAGGNVEVKAKKAEKMAKAPEAQKKPEDKPKNAEEKPKKA